LLYYQLTVVLANNEKLRFSGKTAAGSRHSAAGNCTYGCKKLQCAGAALSSDRLPPV